jgi:hypothetical protein
MKEKRNTYKIMAGKPDEKRPFGRPRHRWETNIKIEGGWLRIGTSDGQLQIH